MALDYVHLSRVCSSKYVFCPHGVSTWLHHTAMFAWALWLANAVLGSLRWGHWATGRLA
jgi:hypothetical protein